MLRLAAPARNRLNGEAANSCYELSFTRFPTGPRDIFMEMALLQFDIDFMIRAYYLRSLTCRHQRVVILDLLTVPARTEFLHLL